VADYGFQLLRERLKKDLQFNAPCYEEKHLKRRLAVRMRTLKINDYDDYLHFLNSQKGEYKKLFNALTINVTEFFRDASTFDALRMDVLPRMIKAKEERGRTLIRIWSTGCSDGKEPYSIAILLHDALRNKITEFSPMIFASDIDDEMLRKAEKGEYLKEEMKGVQEEYIQEYFHRTSHGYKVVDELRNVIKFEHRDLISDRMHSSLDMIICRNVVIYFSREMKEKLYMAFYDALQEGGFLILGKTETLFGEARNKFKIFNNVERIYVK
jgi:chemotaxis protein methyltransferase CheR